MIGRLASAGAPAVPVRAPAPRRPAASSYAPAPPARPWRALILACLGVAGLSLLLPSIPTYDPWAWLIWGREIVHLDLVTTAGPSWKPLPVLFTVPFSLFGDAAAPALWLVVARAGGLLSFAMAYRLAARLAGPVAGVIAALSLVLAQEFIRNFARGYSEGVMVALCLWGLERHLDGRRRDAFLLGAAAALVRPEVWPVIALYGAWLVLSDWWGRRRGRLPARLPWRTVALVAATGLVVAALWFVPEHFGSGNLFRAAARARQANPDNALYAAHPFFEVWRRSALVLAPPVLAGALIALVAAARDWRARRGGGVRLAIGASAFGLMVAVAVMTQAGFAGNLRYVALPAALVCVLAGAGWVELVRGVRARRGRRAAAALVLVLALASAPFEWYAVHYLVARDVRLMRSEADLYGTLRGAIAHAGGAAAVKACGQVFTGPYQTQAVAWYLHLHGDEVSIFPFGRGTIVGARYSTFSRDPRYERFSETRQWEFASSCAAGAGG